jgi:multiple sugar transport system ATP-binding protein
MNMIEATLQHRDGGYIAMVGDQPVAIPAETVKARPGLAAYAGRELVLGIRPEDLEDAELATDTPPDRRLRGVTQLTEALGSEIMVHFSIEAKPAMTEDVRELAQDVGDDRAASRGGKTDSARLVGRFGARSRVRQGEPLEIAVDARSLNFFDPQSGLGIYNGTATKGAES